MKTFCVCIEKGKAEAARRELYDAGVLSKGFKVLRDGEEVCFPITGRKGIPARYAKAVRMVELKANPQQKAGDLKERLIALGKIGKKQAESIINSYDCVGEIAIVEIPAGLEGIQEQIGLAVMEQNGHIKVVAKKESGMEGVFRVRRMSIIAGERRTETVYKESGCRMLLDVAKVYFSVRLSHERLRIAGQVRRKERILALFAGVGPFALVIARRRPDCEIVGIELNPEAVRYFERNIALNKAKNVKAILGDVNTVVPKKYKGWADRIMMPLPHTAGDFLDAALAGANRKGCKIHFYGFVQTRDESTKEPVEDIYAPLVKLIRERCAAAGLSCRVTNKRVVRPYAPYMVQASIDFVVRSG